MESLKSYKTVKQYLTDIQCERLEEIIDVVVKDSKISKDELVAKTKKNRISDARRKIAYLARFTFNIEGNIIAKRLNIQKEWSFVLVYTAFGLLQVDKTYREEIENLLIKLDEKNT